MNYYRNLDRNSELWQTSVGQTVRVPALFMIGDGDSGLGTLGMEEMTAGMLELVPDLRDGINPRAGERHSTLLDADLSGVNPILAADQGKHR
ncbi:hypothetical protein P6U16_11170 [Rhizobium sp. 32-5/1]|uniref:hypothetical protein n=1 Tax=Rhizobium sp. 32-5/1 TaxID=3019602 RepID=UPI00240CFB5C|nr:hypothetical protein [Rhizobium sp. 32-5/1]WEZ81862.1 hypothetical protein P6U16_11170 [Rhizobium sp. 32-5/1]